MSTKTVNIHEAKTHLSELLALAMQGEDVVIAKANKPMVRLVPIKPPRLPRRPGSARGQVLYISPDFDETPQDFKDYV
jgi:prevent-host-death family protein